jgi:TnpA family transposase
MIQSCGNPQERRKFYVLQVYGQLLRTRFILCYLQSQPLYQRIHALLNKGEELHALHAWL